MKIRKLFQKSMLYALVMCCLLSGVIGIDKMVGEAASSSVSCGKVNLALNETERIDIDNKKKNAQYTYISSDKKVASVTQKGAVTGKKEGKTKITVKETYKGKTKKIGTVSVTVFAATISEDRKQWEEKIDSQTGYWKSEEGKEEGKRYFGAEKILDYSNKKATYKIYSSDTDLLKVKTDGTIVDAVGEGEVTLTVEETYKKKTTTIGSFKVQVVQPFLEEESVRVDIDEYFIAERYIENDRACVVVFKEEIVTEEELQADWERLAQKKGKVPALVNDIFENDPEDKTNSNEFIAREQGVRYVYYGIKNYDNDTYETLGYIRVEVKSKDVADRVFMMWDKTVEIGTQEIGYEMETGKDAYLNIYTEPYKYTGEFTVEVEDTSIVSAEEICKNRLRLVRNESVENGILILHPKKPGVTNVTVHANGASNTFKVSVYASADYKTNDRGIVTFYSVMDVDALIEESGEKGWRFESSDPDILKIRDYSCGERERTGESKVIMVSDAYFDTYEEGEVTISAYYNEKLVGQKIITVKK